MPDKCPVCQQDFKIEPGFYSGALWVSFPILVLIAIPLSFYLIFATKLPVAIDFLIIGAVVFGLQPLIMRLSRAIWINVFVHYKQ
jgi:hypothetical protein